MSNVHNEENFKELKNMLTHQTKILLITITTHKANTNHDCVMVLQYQSGLFFHMIFWKVFLQLKDVLSRKFQYCTHDSGIESFL